MSECSWAVPDPSSSLACPCISHSQVSWVRISRVSLPGHQGSQEARISVMTFDMIFGVQMGLD